MSEDEKIAVVHEINSQIALGVKVLLVAIIPLCLSGIVLLIANHYGQQQLKEQMRDMASTAKRTNERVTVMWMLGGYAERIKPEPEAE